MEIKEEKCSCGGLCNDIVMACSGASDVGLLSDKVARSLQIANKRKMACLAEVGAGLEAKIEGFKTKNLLMIDGCPIACGKKILDQHGFTNYEHLVITDLNFKKGDSPATEQNIKSILTKINHL